MVTAGNLLYFLGFGPVFYGFSAFFNPMIAEFGWFRVVTVGAYSLLRYEIFASNSRGGKHTRWVIERKAMGRAD